MNTDGGSADASRGPRDLLVPTEVLRKGLRVFSSSKGQRRSRRASDVLILAPSALALIIMTLAYPAVTDSSSLGRLVASLPSELTPVWEFLFDLLTLWAVVAVVASVVRQRWVILTQTVASLVVATAMVFLVVHGSTGDWPSFTSVLGDDLPGRDLPEVRVVQAAVVVLAISPHLTRPLQKISRWLLLLGLVGAFLADHVSPGSNISAFLIAFTAAAAVRLAFGTSAGYPELDEITVALRQLGVPISDLVAVDRRVSGAFVARAHDPQGDQLLVKVYGRDAYDNQLVEKLWRTALYRDPGPGLRTSRAQAVEHEAFVTLLAASAGIPTHEVVTAGQSVFDDSILVLRGQWRTLATLTADQFDDDRLAACWGMLDQLERAHIAHLRIHPETITIDHPGGIGLIDFEAASVSPTENEIAIDRVQMLAATAAVAGADRALAAAHAALGDAGIAALLPYLQNAALGGTLRRTLRIAEVDPDELRKRAIELSGAEPPQMIKMRRVTWGSVAQLVLLGLAASAVVSGLSGVDFNELQQSLQDAVWAWIVVGFVMAQTPRLTQTISTMNSVAADLPFGPVYIMQLATGYMNLALPSSLARMAINIRFFQRQGVPPAAAVTSGAIDSFVGNVIQAVLLVLLLLFSRADVSVDMNIPTSGAEKLLFVLIGLAVVNVLVIALVPRVRNAITSRVHRWWPDVKRTLAILRGSNKLAMLLAANVATELLFAISLGLFARGLGADISIADLLVINVSVSLFATFIPVPGGIGVTEFGLTVGLTGAGMSEEAALATALLYRFSTFYIPPIWGFFALRWLQRHNHL